MFNELWVELRGVDYMIDVSEENDHSLCQLMLFKNSLGFNVFGAPLLKGYYTIHDPVKNAIGFVPTPLSPKIRLPLGTVPEAYFVAPLTYEISIWVYVITSVFIILLAGLYYFLLLPELKIWIPDSPILVTGIATVFVNGVVAAYVFLLLPLVKKWFG